MNRALHVVVLLFVVASGLPARAESDIATEAPNWCAFARQSLTNRDGSVFNCATATRCIKMNNYACTQNQTSTPVAGQLKTSDGRAIHDPQNHVLFEHPKWSLHRTISILSGYYYNRGARTPLAIAEIWAPWCDTQGSKPMKGPWGRTCVDNKPSVAPSFTGPRCQKPVGLPSTEQCKYCNCPNQMAAFYKRGMPGGIEDPIVLFDESRKPTALMKTLLPQMFIYEINFVVQPSLVQAALDSYVP